MASQIQEVDHQLDQQPTQNQVNELHLFAGAGGGILGGMLLGHTTVCAVEIEPYCRRVLLQRQRDGILPRFPIWDDVRTFDGKPWRGRVDVVCGGFPCQDISCAGKGAGIDGARSGMWVEMARIICEVGPRYVFVENSPMLTSRGLGRVLGDLAEMGYDAEWGVLGACHAGAPHKRERIWILADRNGLRELQPQRIEQDQRRRVGYSGSEMANSYGSQRQGTGQPSGIHEKHSDTLQFGAWWRHDPAEIPKSGLGRMAHGVASRVDRLRAIGNGQVPSVAALAWKTLEGGEL
jgi:DNA (cytosine-5)-methyltransferase 1